MPAALRSGRLRLSGRFDIAERLPDAAADLAAPGDGKLGDAIRDGAPEKLERFGEHRSGRRGCELVSPGSLVPAGLVVHDGEGEQPAFLDRGDDRRGRPLVPAELVVAAETGTDVRACCSIEPDAAVALRAPFAHAGDVGDESENTVRRRGNVDPSVAAFCGWHSQLPLSCRSRKSLPPASKRAMPPEYDERPRT